MSTTYTKEGIMAQVYIAFGQGTGEVRVSQEAALALRKGYFSMISDKVVESWETDAVQALERIRAVGRKAAQETTLAANTVIKGCTVEAAVKQVNRASDTDICRP